MQVTTSGDCGAVHWKKERFHFIHGEKYANQVDRMKKDIVEN